LKKAKDQKKCIRAMVKLKKGGKEKKTDALRSKGNQFEKKGQSKSILNEAKKTGKTQGVKKKWWEGGETFNNGQQEEERRGLKTN